MGHSEKFLKIVDDAKSRIQELDIHQVKQKFDAKDKFYFIDTREDREWMAGHICDAIHMGKGVLERDIEGVIPDTEAEIILYCGGGFRSALSADNLQKMGYSNVYSMDGGFRGWKDAGYPVTLGD